MDELNSIVSFTIGTYGHIQIKLADMLEKRNITRFKLHTLTGIKYEVIDRYYKAQNVERVDLDFLAKVCCVLKCSVSDLLEYVPESPNQPPQHKTAAEG